MIRNLVRFFTSLLTSKSKTSGTAEPASPAGTTSSTGIGTPDKPEIRIDVPVLHVSFGGGVEGEDYVHVKAPTLTRFDVKSDYGERIDPITKAKSFHKGIDLATPVGTPVYPPEVGEIISAMFKEDGAGRRVIVLHRRANFAYYSQYEHLSEIIVKPNQRVGRETCLGKTGGDVADPQAGRSTGAHLHFGTRKYPSFDPIKPVLDWTA